MKELEQRKRLLAAEAEVYRGMLKLELHNIRIYGLKTKKKLTSFRTILPMLLTGIPAAGAMGPLGFLFRKKRGPINRLAAAGLLGWQVYSGITRLLNAFTSRRYSACHAEDDLEEELRL